MPDEPDEDLSQLELPSLFRRKKGSRKPKDAEPVEPEPTPTPSVEADPAPVVEADPAPPVVETPEPAPVAEADPAPPAVEADPAPPAVEEDPAPVVEQRAPASASRPGDGPTTPTTAPEQDVEPPTLAAHFSRGRRRGRAAPLTAAEKLAAAEAEAARAAERLAAAEAEAARAAESPEEVPADEAEDRTATRRLPRWLPARGPKARTEAERQPAADPATPAEPAARESDEPRGPSPLERLAAYRLPAVSDPIAATVVGAVTGLVAVALVLLTQRITDTVRGTDNAGAAGLFLVVGILALAVVVGAAGLRAWGQSDVLSTSFLGTGLVTVLVMLFLLPAVDQWWMVIVVPVLGAAAYALSWWVSNRLGPEARRINDEYSPEVHR